MTMTDPALIRERLRDQIYELLPAVYRERDAALGEPLRALLRIVGGQASLVEADIRQLWADFFVETCEPWVVPYIGDLVGTTTLFDASRIRQPDTAGDLFPDLAGPRLVPEVALRARADVAKTIYYRRRKGTLPMLEELARDVTGWGAHAVEFFELLGWSQWTRNHLRMHSPRTPDIRRVEPIDRLDGPFDRIAHTVDVRPISQLEGRHNIRNVGFFLWRLKSLELDEVQARPVGGSGDFRYHVSPLGNPAPLFTRWRREGDEAGLATELHVPGPIRPAAFYEDLARYRALPAPGTGFTDFYGLFEDAPGSTLPQAPDASLMVFRDGVPVPPEQVRCVTLDDWRQPLDSVVGIDVRRGRLAFGLGFEPADRVDVSYHAGFPAELGGGPYERGAWLVRRALADLVVTVDQSGQTPGSATTLADALQQWVDAGRPNTIISIVDNRTYVETAPAPGAAALSVEPRDGRWLVIEADNGKRPHLRLVDGPLEIVGAHPDASVTLSGLLVEGWVRVSGSLGRLRLLHSTLVPGRALADDGGPTTDEPSLVADPGTAADPLNADLRVELAFSVTGALRIPDHAAGLWIVDGIVDAVALGPDGPRPPAIAGSNGPAGPATWLERVTILGPSAVKELTMASEVIFAEPVVADRRQAGCVRFSFVPDGSATPQRYRCQPDLEAAVRIEAVESGGATLTPSERDAIRAAVREWLLPAFTTLRYGQPAYLQLHLFCPIQLQTGAEDGSEMGAYCHLKQPQRAANLRLRLDEYLPFGLEAGVIYVT